MHLLGTNAPRTARSSRLQWAHDMNLPDILIAANSAALLDGSFLLLLLLTRHCAMARGRSDRLRGVAGFGGRLSGLFEVILKAWRRVLHERQSQRKRS